MRMKMVSPKKLALSGIGSFVGGILIGWAIFPPILKWQVIKATKLKVGAERRPLWEKIPFAFDFKIYIFNISNPEGIEKGEKPIVKEVGPFFYESWKEKVNLVDFEEDDTVEFNTKTMYYAHPEKGTGLTGDEELMIPHTVMMGIIYATLNDNPKLISLVGKAVDSIFGKPETLFMPIKAKDLLFDGILIDCSNIKDVPGKGVCAALKQQAELGVFQEVGEMQFKFSLFGARNNTPSRQRWRARRGIKHIRDVGMMVEYDGKPAMETYNGEFCNALNGTDGTIFAPFLDKKVPLRAFSPDLCKIVYLKYEHPSKVKGIRTARYSTDLGDIPNTPEMECFCKTPDKCPKKGTLDLSKCMGAPIIATLPHFYLADESCLNSVIGLNPDKEKHEIAVDFDLLSGAPIQATSRMQFNVQIFPAEKSRLVANFPEAMLPLFWIEETVIVPKFIRNQVKLGHFAVRLFGILKWLMLVGGFGVGFAGLGFHMKQKKQTKKLEVVKVTPRLDSRESTAEKKSALGPKEFKPSAIPPNLDGN